MKKFTLVCGFFLAAFQVLSTFSFAQSNQEDNIPFWLKRIEYAVEVTSDQKPKYYLESVQPLLGTQENETVFFNQARISQVDYRPAYNFGLGLRRIFDDWYLLGINSFYDFQDLNQHSRAGVGFEAMTDKGLEARLNSYLRVSSDRIVKEGVGGTEIEKVANGYDWELGGPLPYLPPVRLYAGGYWYDFEHFKNKYGWKMRAEYSPLKLTRFTFETFDDTKRSKVGYKFEGAFRINVASFHPKDILNELKLSKEAFPKVNLSEKVLERVVRDNDITVIKSTKAAGGLTVEAGRT